jgi:hypothetical protein
VLVYKQYFLKMKLILNLPFQNNLVLMHSHLKTLQDDLDESVEDTSTQLEVLYVSSTQKLHFHPATAKLLNC